MKLMDFSLHSLSRILGFFPVFLLFLAQVFSKECTNIPTQLSSHTVRYNLLSSSNDTFIEEIFSHYHLTHTDDAQWSSLLPPQLLREKDQLGNMGTGVELDWSMMYRQMKHSNGGEQGDFLKEVPLQNVRLDPNSIHGVAQQTNLQYLLMLDVNNLVFSFRKTAGLPNPGVAYGGWEAADCELRGHFVGHYLSASAMMWASTHNATLHDKMTAVVDALDECQKAIGSGYLSAFPSEEFDRVEAIRPVWAPYYTIHKIMAGLLDQYTFAGNAQAYQMILLMAEYFGNRVKNVIETYTIERQWTSLNEESGGMNDVLYRLYSVSGDQKHLVLAHLFDKPCFLGMLALQDDSLSGFHTNTHIPLIVGTQMRYEVTGDPLARAIGTYFLDVVNSSHTYATGGTSVSEFWSDPKRLATTLETENEESCTTYNMLKVSRHLFRWTKEIAYADYYERALTNGVLSIQRGRQPGIMIYMLPLGRGVSKAKTYHQWGTPFTSFWCCYGTGIESFSKLGDSIYFEEDGATPKLYIAQFISSSFNWSSGGLTLTQKVHPVVSSDLYHHVSVKFSTKEGNSQESTINIRIPNWSDANKASATLNAQKLVVPSPGNFLTVTRKWTSEDEILLELPLELRTDAIQDDRPEYASIKAILFGPYLLAGLSHGEWDLNLGAKESLFHSITPIPPTYNSYLITLTQTQGSRLVLSKSNNTVTMENLPLPGTDEAASSTFRWVPKSNGEANDTNIIGKIVVLEPFDFPGMPVMHHGPDTGLFLSDDSDSENRSNFRVVAGLDGNKGSVSFESESHRGCYIHAEKSVQLKCKPTNSGGDFETKVSFGTQKGLSQYHGISFMAKGPKRNFLFMPLLSLRDEFYTVYFNVTTA
ncbi:hypothetical protein AMTRI_Chr03g139300 [Amborella trichopoda]